MCKNMSYIHKYELDTPVRIPVPCRVCPICRMRRVNDLVGRALCEASTSTWTLTLTLTYAPGSGGYEREIFPPHFQNFVRKLRSKSPLRYLAVGEYGSLRGRAHFHVILFGTTDARPNIPDKENTHIKAWPHGHVYADWSGDRSAIRYCLKYVLKDQNELTPRRLPLWVSMSKKPPLGAAYFEARAKQFAEWGILPTSWLYEPPGGDGRKYNLTGVTRINYLRDIVRGLRGKVPWEQLEPFIAEAIEGMNLVDFKKLCAQIDPEEDWQRLKDKYLDEDERLDISWQSWARSPEKPWESHLVDCYLLGASGKELPPYGEPEEVEAYNKGRAVLERTDTLEHKPQANDQPL